MIESFQSENYFAAFPAGIGPRYSVARSSRRAWPASAVMPSPRFRDFAAARTQGKGYPYRAGDISPHYGYNAYCVRLLPYIDTAAASETSSCIFSVGKRAVSTSPQRKYIFCV